MPAQERTPDFALFLALLATALSLGGALAHAFELPTKLTLPRTDYFIVQQIYSGWDKLIVLLGAQLIGILATLYCFRTMRSVFRPALAALVFLALAQIVFWAFTFPANNVTANWTAIPDNWEAVRARWEFSHLAGAACQVLAMISLIVAALAARRRPAVG